MREGRRSRPPWKQAITHSCTGPGQWRDWTDAPPGLHWNASITIRTPLVVHDLSESVEGWALRPTDTLGAQCRKALLKSAQLTLFPVRVSFGVWMPADSRISATVVGLTTAFGVVVPMAPCVRFPGRRIEPRLYAEMGRQGVQTWQAAWQGGGTVAKGSRDRGRGQRERNEGEHGEAIPAVECGGARKGRDVGGGVAFGPVDRAVSGEYAVDDFEGAETQPGGRPAEMVPESHFQVQFPSILVRVPALTNPSLHPLSRIRTPTLVPNSYPRRTRIRHGF